MKLPDIPVYQLNDGKEGFAFSEWKHKNDYAELPHINNYDEVLFFHYGAGTHEINNVKYNVQPYSLHFIAKGQVQRLSTIKNTSGYSLLFSDILYYPYLSEKAISALPLKSAFALYPVLNLNLNEFTTIIALLKNIQNQLLKTQCKREDVGNYLSLLFTYIQLCYSRNSTEGSLPQLVAKSKIVKAYLQIIETHYTQHLSVQQYADILCTAPNYLNELCKKELGITAQQVVKNMLVSQAKRMLLYSDHEIKEIAFELGFCDAAHFSHFFKKYTGYTPKFYKQQL